MLAAIIFVLFTWFDFKVATVAAAQRDIAANYRVINEQQNMIVLSEGIEQYYRENNSFPADLSTLISTPGYEYIAGSLGLNQGYAVSGSIVDSIWTFQRMVTFRFDSSNGLNETAYLTTNACGSGAFGVAQSWCGAKQSLWFKRENRESFNGLIVTQRARLIRLSQKFANYFNKNQKYPNTDKNSVALVANTNTSLVTLTGYAGTAKNCSTQLQYSGIPIDCGDLYDLWGGQVGYQFIDNNHFILTSEPPILNAAGNRVVIALDRT